MDQSSFSIESHLCLYIVSFQYWYQLASGSVAYENPMNCSKGTKNMEKLKCIAFNYNLYVLPMSMLNLKGEILFGSVIEMPQTLCQHSSEDLF